MMIPPQSVIPTSTQPIAPAPPAAAPVATLAPEPTAAEPTCQKGLLDYPKDLAMGITEYAAEGQAKNRVELFEDISDVKENLGDSWEHLKKGEVLSAAGDTLRAGFNTLSAGVNFFQTGLHSLLGGVSTVVSLPLNLLDKGAEKAGAALSKSDSAVGRAVGKVSTFIGGENSNTGYFEAINQADLQGAQEARQD